MWMMLVLGRTVFWITILSGITMGSMVMAMMMMGSLWSGASVFMTSRTSRRLSLSWVLCCSLFFVPRSLTVLGIIRHVFLYTNDPQSKGPYFSNNIQLRFGGSTNSFITFTFLMLCFCPWSVDNLFKAHSTREEAPYVQNVLSDCWWSSQLGRNRKT